MDSADNRAIAASEGEFLRLVPLTLVANHHSPAKALRSTNLGAFLVEAGEQIHALRSSDAAAVPFAETAFGILTTFLERETGCTSLEDSMGLLFHQMWGGAAQLRLLADLFYNLRSFLCRADAPSADEDLPYDRTTLLNELESVLSWYGHRKVSLAVLEEECARQGEADALFGMRIFDQKCNHGQPGFEVACGLRISGHAGEQLWLKVQFREGSRFLKGRHAWLDQAGLKYCTRATEGRVSAVLPISPEHQRLMIDEAKLFIPYVALGLQPGTQTVEVVLSLTSRDGAELLSAARPHTFIVPPSFQVRDVSLYSPHLLGMWENDPVHGDGLSCFSVAASSEALTITGDVSLYDREEAPLTLACRVLYDDETEVPLSDESRARLKAVLTPDRPVKVYQGLTFSLPLLALNLEAGHYDVLVEVTLCACDGRLLFGTRETACVEIAPITVENPLAGFLN